MMSMMVSWKACPMCRVPVTFGGGITMQKGAPDFEGEKYPESSHDAYILVSISFGLYVFSNSIHLMRFNCVV